MEKGSLNILASIPYKSDALWAPMPSFSLSLELVHFLSTNDLLIMLAIVTKVWKQAEFHTKKHVNISRNLCSVLISTGTERLS